jgi:DNA (cytosine-5)-methyltransferase 1
MKANWESRPPLLLDLFCGAGGCATGYARAGFEIIGVDNDQQPRYPADFRFIEADWLVGLERFLAEYERPDSQYHNRPLIIHASPPCQFYSRATKDTLRINHPDLIATVRERLLLTGLPFIIENVEDAPMSAASITLCGTMFGLGANGYALYRHRKFESRADIILRVPSNCDHFAPAITISGNEGGFWKGSRGARRGYPKPTFRDWETAMEIDWMSRKELPEAIPPAYTYWIGKLIIASLEASI